MPWYQSVFVDRWPWWVGGPAIGLFALAFFFFQNRLLGASSTYQAVVETLQGKGNPDKPDFNPSPMDLGVDPSDKAPRWRAWFWVGMFVGGLAAGALAGTYRQTLLPGLGAFLGLAWPGQLAVLFCGGLLIGSGTRMSGGCTSGHTITGISHLQLPSFLATLVFFGVAVALTFGLQLAWGRP